MCIRDSIQSGEDILQVPVTQLGDTFICDVEGTKDFLMQGGEAVFTLQDVYKRQSL